VPQSHEQAVRQGLGERRLALVHKHAVHVRSAESRDEIERTVTRVMLDLVNYCTYEMGDEAGTLTPSVPKTQRQIVDDFEAALNIRANAPAAPCPAVQSASCLEPPPIISRLPVDEVLVDDTQVAVDHVEHEIWQTVRDLVRQVMLNERDTLRRKAKKINQL